MARPARLTTEVQDAVCAALAAGRTYREAALAAGVGRSTLLAWLAKGRAGERGFCEFCEAVKKARLEARAARMRALRERGWQGAWLLCPPAPRARRRLVSKVDVVGTAAVTAYFRQLEAMERAAGVPGPGG